MPHAQTMTAASTRSKPGAHVSDVVDVTTFRTNPSSRLDTVTGVREDMIGTTPRPNRTAVGATCLAGFDLEIKAIARIPQAA